MVELAWRKLADMLLGRMCMCGGLSIVTSMGIGTDIRTNTHTGKMAAVTIITRAATKLTRAVLSV